MVTKPVRKATPVSTRRPPMAFSTFPRCWRKRTMKAENGSTRRRRGGTGCRGRANRPPASPRPSPPSPRRPRPPGSPRGSARCTASSRRRRRAPSHRRPTGRPACGIRARFSRHQQAIGVIPEEMQPHDDDDDAGDDRELIGIRAQQPRRSRWRRRRARRRRSRSRARTAAPPDTIRACACGFGSVGEAARATCRRDRRDRAAPAAARRARGSSAARRAARRRWRRRRMAPRCDGAGRRCKSRCRLARM